MFGALISATDPVAVVAVFREVGVPRRLLTLVEGENLLNDGVAIGLVAILVEAATGESVSVVAGVLDFFTVFGGGAVIESFWVSPPRSPCRSLMGASFSPTPSSAFSG